MCFACRFGTCYVSHTSYDILVVGTLEIYFELPIIHPPFDLCPSRDDNEDNDHELKIFFSVEFRTNNCPPLAIQHSNPAGYEEDAIDDICSRGDWRYPQTNKRQHNLVSDGNSDSREQYKRTNHLLPDNQTIHYVTRRKLLL